MKKKTIWSVACLLQKQEGGGLVTTQTLSVREGTEDSAKAGAIDYALAIRPGFGIVSVLSQKYEVGVK